MNKIENNQAKLIIDCMNIATIVSREQGATIKEMMAETGKSRRTIYRMLERIDNLGFTITEDDDDRRGKEKVYRTCSDSSRPWKLTLPSMTFTTEEEVALALILDKSAALPEMKEVTDRVRQKIRQLSAEAGASLQNAGTFRIMEASQIPKRNPENITEYLTQLLKAISENKRCRINYYSASADEVKEKVVLPLYCFFYEGGAYFFAKSTTGEGYVSTYAAERLKAVPEILDEKVTDDTDTSRLEAIMNDPFGPFPDMDKTEVKIWINQWQGWYASERKWPQGVKIEQQEDGSYLMVAETCCYMGLRRWLLSQGAEAKLLEPVELKKRIRRSFEEAARIYQD